jgi:hypothetical protein
MGLLTAVQINLCSPAVLFFVLGVVAVEAERILAHLSAEVIPRFATITCVTDVPVLRAEKF